MCKLSTLTQPGPGDGAGGGGGQDQALAPRERREEGPIKKKQTKNSGMFTRKCPGLCGWPGSRAELFKAINMGRISHVLRHAGPRTQTALPWRLCFSRWVMLLLSARLGGALEGDAGAFASLEDDAGTILPPRVVARRARALTRRR